jgi:predicted acylesterase/phospholipase RssA
MHEADVGNDHVVFETDRELTGWTRRALRQADRVVVVMSPRPDVAERAMVAGILASLDGLDHVARMAAIVHPRGTEHPHGTARLIDEFGFSEVVHLRQGEQRDLARLGRLASGNGVGLVLSGGGARGFAHIGVYRALCELGIPIDAVAGCSMGAPLAAGAALLVTPERSVEVASKQFHRLLDYTVPVVSLIKGARITASIDETLHGLDIEDLWLPFACVSTNLTQSRLEVHRRGDAATAVRASVAIPGVLPPVPYHGDLLVDGGVLNNLPFETLRDDGRIDTVIAVDVAPAVGPRAKSDYGLSVSGFAALSARIRRSSPYPSVAAVLLRSMLTGAVLHQQTSLRGDAVDLYVHLQLPGVGLLEFERVEDIAAQGYRASIDQVRDWVATRPHLVTTS